MNPMRARNLLDRVRNDIIRYKNSNPIQNEYQQWFKGPRGEELLKREQFLENAADKERLQELDMLLDGPDNTGWPKDFDYDEAWKERNRLRFKLK